MKKRTFMHTAAALALASALPVAHAQSTPIKFQLDWRFEGPAALSSVRLKIEQIQLVSGG